MNASELVNQRSVPWSTSTSRTCLETNWMLSNKKSKAMEPINTSHERTWIKHFIRHRFTYFSEKFLSNGSWRRAIWGEEMNLNRTETCLTPIFLPSSFRPFFPCFLPSVRSLTGKTFDWLSTDWHASQSCQSVGRKICQSTVSQRNTLTVDWPATDWRNSRVSQQSVSLTVSFQNFLPVSQSNSQFSKFFCQSFNSQSLVQSVFEVFLPVSLQVSQILLLELPVSQLSPKTCKVLCQSGSQSVFDISYDSQSASQSDIQCQSVKKLADWHSTDCFRTLFLPSYLPAQSDPIGFPSSWSVHLSFESPFEPFLSLQLFRHHFVPLFSHFYSEPFTVEMVHSVSDRVSW